MFLYHHCMLPTCFDELFTTNNQIHGYNTRSAGNYRSHALTNCLQQTIKYMVITPDLLVTIDLMLVELILSSSPFYTQDRIFGILYLQI